MPKTNDATGATYAGYRGVVEHAGGAGSTRPGGMSEVNPELNLDGSLIEGDHPDMEADAEQGERFSEGNVTPAVAGDVTPVERSEDNAEGEEHPADEAKSGEEEQPSEEEKPSAASRADKRTARRS